MSVKKFEDLPVWQKARSLSLFVFQLTQERDFNKDFRFRDQIRSSSGSIMDNIGEGFERGGNKEFCQFLYIAKGSCGETRSQSWRAFDFKYISQSEFDKLIIMTEEISRELFQLIKYLKNSGFKGEKYND
jgi:four helix bundle protein